MRGERPAGGREWDHVSLNSQFYSPTESKCLTLRKTPHRDPFPGLPHLPELFGSMEPAPNINIFLPEEKACQTWQIYSIAATLLLELACLQM